MSGSRSKPDYGVDAPGVARFFGIAGPLLLAWGIYGARLRLGDATIDLHGTCIATGVVFTAESVLMLVYSKHGKFSHRERMLALHAWKGDERVLDVGSGRGLLMIGAAKRLTTGHAEGLDIWSAKDLSGNTAGEALRNAELEGVAERVQQHTGSIVKTDFPDGSYDVVISNLCLHNISKRAERDAACSEIARLLRPGGEAIISDFKHTRQYAAVFKQAGLHVKHCGTRWLDTFPPLTVIRAVKPLA